MESQSVGHNWVTFTFALLLQVHMPNTQWGQINWNMGLPRWFSGKESTCQLKRCQRCSFNPWVGKIPWRRKWQPTPVFLPGKFHAQRNLTGYSPWGCRVRHDWGTEHACMETSWHSASLVMGPGPLWTEVIDCALPLTCLSFLTEEPAGIIHLHIPHSTRCHVLCTEAIQ